MIQNAKNTGIGKTPFLPEVASAVRTMLQPTSIGIVKREQVDGMTQEIPFFCRATLALQPMSEQLAVKKEGDRSWRWWVLYMTTETELSTDDVVIIFGDSYRVMSKENWKQHGYVKYEAIEFYKKYDT